jgi:hypothetical protein
MADVELANIPLILEVHLPGKKAKLVFRADRYERRRHFCEIWLLTGRNIALIGCFWLQNVLDRDYEPLLFSPECVMLTKARLGPNLFSGRKMISSSGKGDYFGTFLETLKDPGADLNSAPSAVPRDGEVLATVVSLLQSGAKTLTELLKPGEAISGISAILSAIKILQSVGYVTQVDGEKFELTESGRTAAQHSAPPAANTRMG